MGDRVSVQVGDRNHRVGYPKWLPSKAAANEVLKRTLWISSGSERSESKTGRRFQLCAKNESVVRRSGRRGSAN